MGVGMGGRVGRGGDPSWHPLGSVTVIWHRYFANQNTMDFLTINSIPVIHESKFDLWHGIAVTKSFGFVDFAEFTPANTPDSQTLSVLLVNYLKFMRQKGET